MPLAGLPLAQKKSKVRRSMSSKSPGSSGRLPPAGGSVAAAKFDARSASLVSYTGLRSSADWEKDSQPPSSPRAAALPPRASRRRRVRSIIAASKRSVE
jgi:hypothetical protein